MAIEVISTSKVIITVPCVLGVNTCADGDVNIWFKHVLDQ